MAANNDDVQDGSIQDIVPNGDIVLVIEQEGKTTRLRAYSQNLISASGVFRDMIGTICRKDPNPFEGSLLKDIPLDGVDADAMYTICCVIHHRNDLVPDTLSSGQVLQIAIATAKYDFHVALTHARASWLQSGDTADPFILAHLMAAAHLFGDQKKFLEHSQALMLRYTDSYMVLLNDETLRKVMPSHVPGRLRP
ncbi:hypothetical protein PG995_010960 [Apiospora arundinis]